MSVYPYKTIVMFFGDDIPDGWLECNGSSGTPDLRNRFILGGDASNQNKNNNSTLIGNADDLFVETVSGNTTTITNVQIKEHALTVSQIPSHSHELKSNRGLGVGHRWGAAGGTKISPVSYWEKGTSALEEDLYLTNTGNGKGHGHETSVSTSPHSHKVDVKIPYYILRFIMYVGVS